MRTSFRLALGLGVLLCIQTTHAYSDENTLLFSFSSDVRPDTKGLLDSKEEDRNRANLLNSYWKPWVGGPATQGKPPPCNGSIESPPVGWKTHGSGGNARVLWTEVPCYRIPTTDYVDAVVDEKVVGYFENPDVPALNGVKEQIDHAVRRETASLRAKIDQLELMIAELARENDS